MQQRVEAALFELQRYLQDEIPPNSAADALATLMAQPPEVMLQRVGEWSEAHSRTESAPVCDLLLHAMKKVYITGELHILDREAVANYLDRATTVVLRMCPVEERDVLRNNLATMRMSQDVNATLKTPPPPPPRLPTLTSVRNPVADEDAQLAKRFSLIVDRLTRQMSGTADQPQAAAPDPQALAQLLTMAASRSQTGQQFNAYMDQIRPLTGGNEGNVFVILGGGLPSWDLPSAAAGNYKPPAQVDAMEKIIDLAEDPAVVVKRLRELVSAAVTKFNDGSLAAALWMLDVANDTIVEKKLDPAAVDKLRADAAEAISSVQLKKYTENKSRHAALKIALEFFPTLRLDRLFKQLRGEPKAERRRALLGLIEAHGAAGRAAALDGLESEMQRDDADTYFLRNLIFLLHRIQREPDDGNTRELDALAQVSAAGQNIYVIKEAATALAQIRTEESAKLLISRLAVFETLILRHDPAINPITEGYKLLDRIIASLARIGTQSALLAVARHGMKPNPQLGDTRARLAPLAQHDLSFDENTVTVLVRALRDEIPGKLLGRLLPKKQDGTVRLIEALSGTRSDSAEDLFREIAQRFPDQDVGRAAAQVLEKLTPVAPARSEPAATFAGELDFFGLPAVLQSLADMRATGMLTLNNKRGEAAAKLVVVEGKFLNAQVRQIRGVEALYEVLERPLAGTFAFVPYPMERMKSDIAPRDIIGALLEGVRRHDELQRILPFVPDDLALNKTNVKPTPCADESDPTFIREVWMRATSGTAVSDWEPQFSTDGYRIRRLLAHWLEQGAVIAR
jgi:hypothetical protein